MSVQHIIKFGRYYLLIEEKRSDEHAPRLTLVETKQMATWFNAERAKEIEKKYGGKVIPFNSPVKW
ncbi:MAG: hypothetical protein ACLRPU_00045 [Enterococcus hulanensis]